MDAVDLDTVTVQDEALAAVSPTVAGIYEILPLRFENGKRDLVIATAGPDNLGMLTDLGFILSCRIVPIRADKEAITAAIDRHYGKPWLMALPKVLREIEALDARGVIAIARDWLRRALRRLRLRLSRCDTVIRQLSTCPPHERFTSHVILAATESGAREATIEFSGSDGRFHFVADDGKLVKHDLPRKWARRVMRRIMWMAKGSPRHSIPKGRFKLSIGDDTFTYEVTREPTTDGERVVLRLVDTPTPEE